MLLLSLKYFILLASLGNLFCLLSCYMFSAVSHLIMHIHTSICAPCFYFSHHLQYFISYLFVSLFTLAWRIYEKVNESPS